MTRPKPEVEGYPVYGTIGRALCEEIDSELFRACHVFQAFKSDHEGYAVILEELDELWDAVKANDAKHARAEAVQVAAMAIRFILDSERRRNG